MRVLVDGVSAGVIARGPGEVEITGLLGDGPADLRIEATGQRPSPHESLRRTGPARFTATGAPWKDEDHLTPCRPTAPPRPMVRR